MLLWIAMALMTGAAVLAALWPLSRRGVSEPVLTGDVGFYRDQLAEIDRELERGLLPAGEAASARAEAGRRLLRASEGAAGAAFSTGEPALRRRRAASAFSLSVVPLIALAVYGALGSPQLPSRTQSPQAEGDLAQSVRQVEQHLAAHPDDGRGWDVLAPVYLKMDRYADAAKAFAAARRLGGETVGRLTGEAEALVAAAGGVVSAEATGLLDRAVALDPGFARARFYRALGAEQDGDLERARREYEAILAAAPADAPWLPTVQVRLASLSGDAGRLAAEGGPGPDIGAMVAGLDDRLARQGGTEAEWARLVRSFVVLGRADDARDRLAKARLAMAAEPQALASLDRLAGELGLRKREAAR